MSIDSSRQTMSCRRCMAEVLRLLVQLPLERMHQKCGECRGQVKKTMCDIESKMADLETPLHERRSFKSIQIRKGTSKLLYTDAS